MNNKKIRTIASVMIILLAILLIVIFINYNNREYNRPRIVHASGDLSVAKPSGDTVKPKEIEIISGDNNNISGEDEPIIELVESGDNSGEESGELFSGEIVEGVKPPKKQQTKSQSNDSQIIVSRTETSNQEKQEILNEIDDALKDLLDAVGKVQTVDESKLDASLESEVEP